MQTTNEEKEEYNAELESIKETIKDLARRLASMRQEAISSIHDSSAEWRDALLEIKNKIMSNEQDSIKTIRSCIEKNPLQSAIGCFMGGVVLAMLLLRRN